MGERRFVIRKALGEEERSDLSITESELKRRLVEIATYMHSEEGMWPRGIRTLLHGEAKEPPTDAWEEWIQRMPSWIGGSESAIRTYREWETVMKHWFKNMPR